MPRPKKDFWLNPVIITIIIVIISIAIFNFSQNILKTRQLEHQITKIESQITEAELNNKKLKKQINNSDNYEYIEKIAREKLGLVKQGEKVFVPIEKKEDTKIKAN